MIKRGGGNILILTEIGAGDLLIATGAIREIRRLYPSAHVTLFVHSRASQIAELCPYVDEVIISPQQRPNYNLFEFYKVNTATSQELLARRFDICFAFTTMPQMFLLMYMSGAKIRMTSIKQANFDLFNRSTDLAELFMRLATHLFPSSMYSHHWADRYFSVLENLLHLPITNRQLEVWCTLHDVEVAQSHISKASSPIYSLNMGGTHHENCYPPEKYARLLEMILSEESTATFVILGGGEADLKSAAIIKDVAPKIYANNIIDLTNKISYRQSAAVLSHCQMHIGNDTGTMHLSVAAGCPVLNPIPFATDLIIRNTDSPSRWYPYGVPSVIVQPEHALPECKGLHAYRGCATNFPHCITQIEPQMLLRGFHLLKERIEAKIYEPLYIC